MGKRTGRSGQRVSLYLERQGLFVRDAGNSYLNAEGADATKHTIDTPLKSDSVVYTPGCSCTDTQIQQ